MYAIGWLLVGILGVATEAGSDSGHAHPPVEVSGRTFSTADSQLARPVEELSSFCEECHASAAQAPGFVHSIGAGDRSHPVDVAYPEDDPDYVPIADLGEFVPLFEGRLTCLTCHDAADSDHALILTQPPSRSCLACHRK